MSHPAQALGDKLIAVCNRLEQITAADYPEMVGKHSRAEIYRQIGGATYEGRRVSQSWSKPELVAASVAIVKAHVEQEREELLRELHDDGRARKTALDFVKKQQQGKKREERDH